MERVLATALRRSIGSQAEARARRADEKDMAKLKFRPLHDRVVVRRLEAEEKSSGGIIIPDTAKEKPSQGEVLAVGPGGRDETGKLITQMSRPVTRSCSASGPAPRSRSMAMNF
jgi:hypothetical protein